MRSVLTYLAAAMLLAACSESPAPADTAAEAKPAAAAPASAPLSIKAPAGQYALDPNHANLSISLSHLDLSDYIARFTDYQVVLDLAENVEESSVTVTIDPASVAVDYSGDYKATHADSPYDSWQQDLAQSPKFLNAGEHASISFRSTQVQSTPDSLKVTGDLTLLGVTKPLTLTVKVIGDMEAHPFSGNGALGFVATGKIKRSDYGMTHLLDPPLIGDEVSIFFNGELHQQVEPPVVEADELVDTTD